MVKQFIADDRGTVSVEYGFAILFAGGICAAILTVVRDEVSSAFTVISNKLITTINTVKS